MSEQKATEQPPADVPTVIEIPTGLQPPATSGYVQAVNKLQEDTRAAAIETYDLPAHLVGRPKVTADTLAASQPPAGDTWQAVAPREGQRTLRVRPNPLFLTFGPPHHAWMVLDEDNLEVARAHDLKPMDGPLEAATREMTVTDWHCGRATEVRRMSAHVETAGRLMCLVGRAKPVAAGGQ